MTKKKQFAMIEKASVTNHVNEHWVFTFAVGCHYYTRNESGVGILFCVVRGLEIASLGAQ